MMGKNFTIPVPGIMDESVYGRDHYALDKNGVLAIVGDEARPSILKRYNFWFTENLANKYGIGQLPRTYAEGDEPEPCPYCDVDYEDDYDLFSQFVSLDEDKCGKIIDLDAVQNVVDKKLIVFADSGYGIPFCEVVDIDYCAKCGRKLGEN